MAETVYKDIPDLNSATLPLAGTEYIEVSATGATGKALWSGIFGSGWWNWLKAAFSAFKAPDSDHADNADTLGAGLETPTDFHDATQLVGAVPLANIPAELTGKNADTATLAANSTLISGLSIVNGSGGTYGTQSISGGGSWLIPSGTYIITLVTPSAQLLFQIKQATGGVFDFGAYWGGGLVISDGVNYRFYNPSGAAIVISYRKIA